MSTTDIISVQVIAADGEQKAARALKEASETISESSSAMQLRYLQVSWMKNKLDIKSSLKLHPNFDYFIRAKYRCTENTISFFNYGMKNIFLQTLYSISSEKNHTIVFPLPVDVLGNMMGGGGKGDKANVKSKYKETSEKKSL